MRHIDLQTWQRREHFTLFRDWDYPHFAMCANVDLTSFYAFVKEQGISLNVATVYVIARAANAVPEFRYRIRGEEAIEHEIVHPSTTIMGEDDVFGFCTLDYVEDFPEFVARASEKIALIKKNPTLKAEPGRDDLVYMTAIPWVSFTSFMHPLQLYPADSVPRFAWGKLFPEGTTIKMPLGAQGHHALIDGLHMGRYYAEVQGYLDHPDSVLAKA